MSDDDYVGKKILRYPLDLTGASTDNYVDDEPHTLESHTNRVFVPDYGPFFTKGMIVTDAATGKALVEGTQYVPIQSIASAVARSGKDVCGAVAIIDPTVSNNVTFSGQVIGGPYILMVQALIDMLATVNVDTRVFNYGEIVGKPNLFPVGHHLHDVGDIYGFEYLVYVLEDIRQAVLNGDVAALDALRNYIDNLMATHKVSRDHDWLYYTKEQVWTKAEADARYLKKTNASTAITIDGPTSINRGGVGQFHITNFDIYSTYSVTFDGAAVGFFQWPSDKGVGNSGFSITIPSTMPLGSQNLVITCNSSSRTIPVMITDTVVIKPVLTGVMPNGDPTWNLVGSPFAVRDGYADTLAACEWSVINTTTGTIVYNQTTSGVDCNRLILPNMPVSSTFTAQIRYKGSNFGWGEWSDIISVTTKDTYVTVVSPYIDKPSVTATPSTTDGSVSFQISPFTLTQGTDTAYSYDALISEELTNNAASYTYDNLCNGDNAPSFTRTLNTDTKYNIMVRYKGASGEYSDWSAYTYFQTKTSYVAMTGASVSPSTIDTVSPGGGQPPMVTAGVLPTNATGAKTYSWHYVSGDTGITCNSPTTASTYFSYNGNATAYWACTVMEINASGVPVYWETPSVKVVSGSGSPIPSGFTYPLKSVALSIGEIDSNATVPTTSGSTMALTSGKLTAVITPTNADSCSYTWEYVSGDSFTINSQNAATTDFTYNWKYGDPSSKTGQYRCKVTQGSVYYYTAAATITFTTQAASTGATALKSSLGNKYQNYITSGSYPGLGLTIKQDGTWVIEKSDLASTTVVDSGTWATGSSPAGASWLVRFSVTDTVNVGDNSTNGHITNSAPTQTLIGNGNAASASISINMAVQDGVQKSSSVTFIATVMHNRNNDTYQNVCTSQFINLKVIANSINSGLL